jgi:shikimate dehydrogenase
MTDASTTLVGLIGWPVAHSLSPIMHNAAFAALGLNWHYVPLPVRPGEVATAVRGLVALGFRGANVTVPHKQEVMEVTTSLTANARAIGAVNTLLLGRGEQDQPVIMGHNTDDLGFVRALREGGYEPEDGGTAVVVGAGGAARAVVAGLSWSGAGKILILNRTLERAQRLAVELQRPQGPNRPVRALPLNHETLIEAARNADLLINTTSVGLAPRSERSIWPEDVPLPSHLTVFDLVYNPLETCLLRQARDAGARAIDGLGMLVWQGAAAFDTWTNMGFLLEEIASPMRAACEAALGIG